MMSYSRAICVSVLTFYGVCAQVSADCTYRLRNRPYNGTQNVTGNGIPCQRWDSPHNHRYTEDAFVPHSKLQAAENYCREPDGEPYLMDGRPWCYTLGTDITWGYCDVPLLECFNGGKINSSTCSCDCDTSRYTGESCEKVLNKTESKWPTGSYALPMSAFGCPNMSVDQEDRWETGGVTLALDEKLTDFSARDTFWKYHYTYMGPYVPGGFYHGFCLQKSNETRESANRSDWMPGTYCIYQVTNDCPKGFQSSAVQFTPSREIDRQSSGTLPKFDTNNDTSIVFYFCCRRDRVGTTPIVLPHDAPFYLLQESSATECQVVERMRVTEEVFPVDEMLSPLNGNLSDPLNLDWLGPKINSSERYGLHLCFYQSYEISECFDPRDHGKTYRGTVSVTMDNHTCDYWERRSDVYFQPIDNKGHAFQHVGLEGNNYCRLPDLRERPWCYYQNIDDFAAWQYCDITTCDVPDEELENVALGKPTTTSSVMYPSSTGSLAVDGLDATCFVSGLATSPWLQIDLQSVYVIKSVELIIHRHKASDYLLRHFDIHVGMTTDDFKNRGAILCRHDVTLGMGENVWLDCVQPIRGQYLTIQNMVFDDGHWSSIVSVLRMCEVKIYARRTYDGFSLGMTSEELKSKQTKVSSYAVNGVPSSSYVRRWHARLYPQRTTRSGGGWCADINDTDIYYRVNFIRPRLVGSIVTRGIDTHSTDAPSLYTSLFSMSTSDDGINWINYTDALGNTKVFTGNVDNFTPKRNIFNPTLNARHVQIHILSFVGYPCLRFELYGRRDHSEVVCGGIVRDVGVIRSPNFGKYYGENIHCQWDIEAPGRGYVILQFPQLDLEVSETSRVEGDYIVNTGQCTDTIYVLAESKHGEWESVTNLTAGTSPSKIVSPTGRLRVDFKSCFRYSRPTADGFEAYVNVSECAGYGLGYSACPSVHQCTANCGYLASTNYPVGYSPRSTCRWHIHLPPGKYVALQFLDFDILDIKGDCSSDYLEIQDVDVSGGISSIGRFCTGGRRPDDVIYSSRNEMYLTFVSDESREGRGFLASYSEYLYNVSTDIFMAWNKESRHCGENWEGYHGNCYRLYLTNKTSWIRAESMCKEVEGHLVSIRDRSESFFIHFLLTTVWKVNQTKIYIGLNDRQREGHFKWVDGSELTFTDWYTSFDEESMSQPNGGDQEDCGVIIMGNIHTTAYWHDIACANDDMSQFICERPWRAGTDEHIADCVSEELMRLSLSSCLDSQFTCGSGECVSAIYLCDGYSDCTDGTDERNCGSDCGPLAFTCDNGQCISISLYCDFKPDCRDGSDEHNCIRRSCYSGEFQCDNGQCILRDEVCDVEVHCLDGSDEIDCAFCKTGKSFKCYDGRCLPISAQCDGQKDCSGMEHEDERDNCMDESAKRSCGEWREAGYSQDGLYDILPRGAGKPTKVKCLFEDSLERAVNVFHHNIENRSLVKNIEWNYFREFNYLQSNVHDIRAVVTRSDLCEMFIRYECKGSMLGKDSAAIFTYNNTQVDFSMKTESESEDDCICLIKGNCFLGKCSCDQNVNGIWTEDFGYLNNSEFFPLTRIKFGDTGMASEVAYHTIGPLRCFEGIDLIKAMSAFVCDNQRRIAGELKCLHQYDQYGFVMGCRDLSHLENCGSYGCPSDWYKCPEAFCIPFKMLCDGKRDCPCGSDERNCGNFTCDGMYKCHLSTNCIPIAQVCDGVRDCQHADDEQMCNKSCPPSCKCEGYSVVCTKSNYEQIPINMSQQLRHLDLSHSPLMNITFEIPLTQLARLILSNCIVTEIHPHTFMDMVNLFLLDLRFNQLEVISENTFEGLSRLKVLLLDGNSLLSHIEPKAFLGLMSLPSLKITGTQLQVLNAADFEGLGNLTDLNISSNKLIQIEGDCFKYLPLLRALDIQNNTITEYSREIFSSIDNLETLTSDNYAFCCLAPWVERINCLPQRDELSSCQDLMRIAPLRIALWIIGAIAVVANVFVFIYRLKKPERSKVNGLILTNLAVSDFLMGIYLVSIAIVDTSYKGDYFMHAEKWKSSLACDCLGVLATVASEVSMMTLVTLTFDRLTNILFPFGEYKLNRTSVKGVLALVWGVCIVLAAIPLFSINYFGGKFYSRTGVCIPLHLTATSYPGWEYSIAIFMGLNTVMFTFITIGYWYIYQTIKMTSVSRVRHRGGSVTKIETAAARKMAILVFTNVLCWFPIFIIGCLALVGKNLNGDVYAWTVVFVLPINSAFDPILYTISAIRHSTCSNKAKDVASRLTMSGIDETFTFFSFQSDTRVSTKQLKVDELVKAGLSNLAFYKKTHRDIKNTFTLSSKEYNETVAATKSSFKYSGLASRLGEEGLRDMALEAFVKALGKTLLNLHQNCLTLDWKGYKVKFTDLGEESIAVLLEGSCFPVDSDGTISKDRAHFHRVVGKLIHEKNDITKTDQEKASPVPLGTTSV